jgi:hypothetical protein
MSDFVGVLSNLGVAIGVTRHLKQGALMFGQVAIPQLELLRNVQPELELIYAELEWLSQQGVVFEYVLPKPEPDDFKDVELNELMDCHREIEAELRRRRSEKAAGADVEIGGVVFAKSECEARIISNIMRRRMGLDAYPFLFTKPRIIVSDSPEKAANKGDVIHIALKAMPIPDDTVSWEQVLEFRDDPDSYGKFLDLRNWMNETARGELSPIEIEQKLEYLISQYHRHTELHKMKTNAGTLETIVVASATFLENLGKLKFGEIAKGLFSVRHRKAALLESELTSPGREVAYILRANETF